MLAEVAAGRVFRARFGSRTWLIRSDASTHGRMENVIGGFFGHRLAKIGDISEDYGKRVDLTEPGSALLSEWNDKHGNPLT
jgi:hypothetical protein